MIVITTTGLFSLILFVVAVALLFRASGTPPTMIRTHSRRSPEEYAYHRHQAGIRRGGYMCALAAAMTLALCLTMGVVQASLG